MEVFAREESVALLCRRVPELTSEQAGRLAEALGDLPLAVAQAGAHLAETGTTVPDFLALLGERAGEVLAHGAPATYPVSLVASTRIAVDRLAAESPAAVQLLALAAYLAPEPIPLPWFTTHPVCLPEPLAAAAEDRVVFAKLVGLLGRRGLARVEPATVQLHRVLAAILRTPADQQRDLSTRAVRLLRAAAPTDSPWANPPTWPAWRQLLPHVLVTTDTHRLLNGVDLEVAWLLGRAASYLQTSGEPSSAQPLVERALELRSSRLGEDHPDTLDLADKLASCLWALGHSEQACRLSEDTLTRRRRTLGEDDPATLASASNLAVALWALGRYEQARQLDEDTLARYRRVLGEDHPHTLNSASNLALDLWALRRYEQARQIAEDTLTHRRRTLGEDHPDTLISAGNLAACLRELGQYEQARQIAEDTLTRRRRTLGEDHPHTLVSADHFAACLREVGHHEQACRLAEDTLAHMRQILDNEHPHTLRSAGNLALCLQALGQQEQARQLGEGTLARLRQVLGNEHPETLRWAGNLAPVLTDPGEHDHAHPQKE